MTMTRGPAGSPSIVCAVSVAIRTTTSWPARVGPTAAW